MHGGGRRTSLLLTPSGTGTLLRSFHKRLARLHDQPLTIATAFAPTPDYVEAVRASCEAVGTVTAVDALDDVLATCAPGDWVLLADPLCFPLSAIEEGPLLERLVQSRAAVHLVAMDRNSGGTTDRLQFDRRGGVRGIQRYYDARTWMFVSGVVGTLLPASTLSEVADELLGCRSLGDFRRTMAARGVPARDLPVACETLDLSFETNLLRLSEYAILGQKTGKVSERARVSPSARLCGDVVLQDHVEVGANAVVIGPTIVGAGGRIGAGAVVAQCLLGAGAVVPGDTSIRHRVVFGSPSAFELLDTVEPDYDERFAVGSLDEPVDSQRPPVYPAIKTAVDRVMALTGLVLLSPLLALVSLLIRLDSRGPVLYGETRETIGGRLFTCWKFRTMRVGAEAEQRALAHRNQMDGPQFKINGDPRITRLGRWLRKVSIDELPQLYNVLTGDMSLVGPRPSPFRENQICVPWRQARLSVRAGITGLWQVCRNERTHGDFHQWIEYDIMYVRHFSWAVDLRILLATIRTFGGAGRVPHTWIVGETAQATAAVAPAAGELARSRVSV